jgi:release factor glutamine methyltransferase
MVQSGNVTDRAGDAAAPVTVQALLHEGCTRLAGGSESARLDAQLLLAHALRRTRSELLAHDEQRVEATAVAHYRSLLARRALGEPLAYLTGVREFWSLTLGVTPEVLIPRPETELAVERCLALHDASAALVADLGTGSGAIALALALERPLWRIVATDREAGALRVARRNAERVQAGNVSFLQGDWCAPLQRACFDLMVANPPYVAAADPALYALRHEPATALSPGPSGMEALRQIALQARNHLRPGGWLVLEHGTSQAAGLADSLVDAGYARVRCHRDLAGHQRVSEAQWP